MSIRSRLENIECNEDNLSTLYNLFKSVDEYSIPIIRYHMLQGTELIRCRINMPGRHFTKISELSYPPINCVKKYGRANVPYNPMFYCSVFSDTVNENAPYPRVVSLLETSFIANSQMSGIERSTCSKWVANKSLNLIALPFSFKYDRPIESIKKIQAEWHNLISGYQIDKDGLELIEFMSEEIAKDTSNSIEYFKIANFIFYLLRINPKTKDVDGVIYPSVKVGGEGFNLVLKPEVVDNKLAFEGASLCYLAKRQSDMYLRIVNHSIICGDNIKYVDYIPDIREQIEYSRYAKDLDFIN